jgi:exodeoxyribonuclease VII small subunit
MATDQHPSTEQSFEESLKELEGLVKRFEEGQLTLDQAVEAFTRGTLLKKQCALKLQQAKSKIELVTAEQSGTDSDAPDSK